MNEQVRIHIQKLLLEAADAIKEHYLSEGEKQAVRYFKCSGIVEDGKKCALRSLCEHFTSRTDGYVVVFSPVNLISSGSKCPMFKQQ